MSVLWTASLEHASKHLLNSQGLVMIASEENVSARFRKSAAWFRPILSLWHLVYDQAFYLSETGTEGTPRAARSGNVRSTARWRWSQTSWAGLCCRHNRGHGRKNVRSPRQQQRRYLLCRSCNLRAWSWRRGVSLHRRMLAIRSSPRSLPRTAATPSPSPSPSPAATLPPSLAATPFRRL